MISWSCLDSLERAATSGRSGKKVVPDNLLTSPNSNAASKPRITQPFVRYHNSVAKRVCRWFLPNSRARLTWDIFIFVVIWYNSLVTPIRIFIMSGDNTPQSLVYADVVFDFIFVIDTVLHFYRPYVDPNTGQIVADLTALRKRYLRSATFYVNVIACTPILKTPLSPFLGKAAQEVVMTYFNVLRMVRILHLPSQFQELKRFRRQKGPVNESVFRMCIILFFTLLGMCILGCVYFGLSVTAASVGDVCAASEDFVENIMTSEMWVAEDFVITDVMDPRVCGLDDTGTSNRTTCNDCPQSLFFVRSIYFLMQTLFTIGYGDTVVPSKSAVEMALACIFMVIGVFGYGLIIANMTSVLANLDVVSMRFRHEMDAISRWMSFRCTPEALRDRVNLCFMYYSRTQHGMLDGALFDDLPPKLCNDLAAVHMDFITKIPFFNRSLRSEAFLSRVATAMIRRVYSPGSYILYQNEKQRELVIIKSGRADICVAESTEAVGSLLPGDYMGDYQLLFGTVNQVGLRASDDFVEVLVLTHDNFAQQVMNHPDGSDMMFQALGGTFRDSNDQGALDTIERSKDNLNKILVTITNVATEQKSNKLKDMMEKTEVIFKGFRIQPDSTVHVVWDIVALLSIMYYSISCPIRLAVYIGSNSLRYSFDLVFVLDYTIDLLFVLDVFLRLHVYAYVSYANGRNEVIMDRKQIRTQYVGSEWFAIDLFASIPWDIVTLGTGYYTLCRLPKLARIRQISPLISRLQKNLDECMQRTMNETQLSSLMMFLYSLLIIVWSSSGWNALRYGESGYHSVYWALTTLTTTGYGDQTPVNFRQTCYALFVGAAGATFSAAIIANVTSFFHNTEVSEDSIEHKLNVVKVFMERHQCQHEHVKKVDDYFEYIEREQEGLNEDILLHKSIPDNLRSDMLVHITQSMVLGCDFFTDCESGFIRRLMLSLEQRFFGKQYMILTDSTPADGMYFVKKGIVEILGLSAASVSAASDGTPGLKVTKRLETDDSFAEGCLLSHWETNPFLARAATDCELWFLSRSTFNRLVADFPRARALLSQRDADTHLSKGRRFSAHAILKAAAKARRSRAVFIHPDKPLMQGWVGLILLVTLYNSISLPLRVAFLENHSISSTWIALDYLCDLILLADIVIQAAFLAYFDDNHLILERDKIFSNYKRSHRMKWHVMAALPLEILTLFVPTMCPLWTLQVWSLFRLNKLLRLPEIAHLLSQVESTLAKKAGIKLPRNQLRIGKLIMVILTSAHLVGCIFFIIANLNQHASQGNVNLQRNWANSEGLLDLTPACPGEPVDAHTVWQRYVAALFWSMATLTTVGYGDISAHEDSIAEIVFSTFVLVVGTAIYTLVIALLEDIVAQLDVTSTLFESKMNAVETYTALQGLPEDVKLKVAAYYDNLWRHQLGVNGGKLLRYLPRSLRSDLLFDLLSPLLQQTFFVKDCSSDFVASILRSMTLELYLADDIIFQEGERCDCLSFLYRGDVDLLTSNSVKFKTVSDCLLGESSFFGAEPFICTARAATTCEVFHLHLADFHEQLCDNHLFDKFTSYVRKNNKKLSKSKAAMEKMIKNLNSSKMAKMLSTEDVKTTPKGVIPPNSIARRVWDTIALFFLLVLIFTVPFQISFSGIVAVEGGVGSSVGLVTFIIDCIIDAFFIADCYFRATRFAVMRDGALVDDPNRFRLLYLDQGGFRTDAISSVPASFVAYVAGEKRRKYGFLRLIQLVRVRRLVPYLDDFVDLYATKTGKALSTAFLRISQMFLGVLVLCHWVACVFHWIGDASLSSSSPSSSSSSSSPFTHAAASTTRSNWLVEDGTVVENAGGRYLRSFFWALYTTSTIGYGSVSVISIAERLFAMVAMVVGAVVCDAGITAVLTSIIINRDHQASTNSRRIQCSKCYMTSNHVSRDIQDRVLDYYSYADNKLQNIDESCVLQDLSPSVRGQILSQFCFQPLRSSSLCKEFSNGAVMSLVKTMRPYIAIPGEPIVEIGKESDAIYVLQRGLCTLADSSSNATEQNVPIGALFGHAVTAARQKAEGGLLPSHGMRIEIVEVTGIRSSKSGSPYLEFEHGSNVCRTQIRKNSTWQEVAVLKCSEPPHRLGPVVSISIKGWRRDGAHRLIGSAQAQVPLSDDAALQTVSVTDVYGRSSGTVTLQIHQYELPKDEIPTTHEETVVANGYCHLYRMDAFQIPRLRDYLAKSNKKTSVVVGTSSVSDADADVGADQSDFCDTSRGCSLRSVTTCSSINSNSISKDEPDPYGDIEEEEDGDCESIVSPDVTSKIRLDKSNAIADEKGGKRSTARPTIMGAIGKRKIATAITSKGEGEVVPRNNNESQWRGTLIKTGTIIQNKKETAEKSSIMQRRLGTRASTGKGRSSGGSNTSSAQEERDKRWDALVDMSSAVARSSTIEARAGKATSANIVARRRSFFVDWGE